MTILVNFDKAFPEVASKERMPPLRAHGGVSGRALPPSGDYLVSEAYCLDEDCEADHVVLQIINTAGEGPISTLNLNLRGHRSHGSSTDLYVPRAPHQVPFARAFIPAVERILVSDPGTAERLHQHLEMVRKAFPRRKDKGEAVDRDWLLPRLTHLALPAIPTLLGEVPLNEGNLRAIGEFALGLEKEDPPRTLAVLEGCRVLARAMGDAPLEAEFLTLLATTDAARPGREDGLRSAEEAEVILEEAGRKLEVAEALLAQGNAHIHARRFPQALVVLRRAREKAREAGNPVIETVALTGLVGLFAKMGREDDCEAAIREAVSLARHGEKGTKERCADLERSLRAVAAMARESG